MDADVLRILDANIDRAREALRVIEDYARFALDDRDGAAATKELRHTLTAIIDAVGADALLAARDIVADVGKETKTPRELERGDTDDVVRAAFCRAQEATRVIGEFAKISTPQAAEVAERMRYRAYELEQRMVLRSDTRRRMHDVRVYVLLTESLCRGLWLDVAGAVLRGGADCVQLREKNLPDGELLARAAALRDLTREHGALLAINDRADIARLAGADIVHVGQDDLCVRDARRIAGGRMLIGKSTHTQAQFDAARSEEPDYLAVGPMFQSPTKPQEHIAGVETLRAVRAQSDLPLVAIGGVTLENAASIVGAGADALAVCSTVLVADDVEGTTRALREIVEAARKRRFE